MERKLNETQPVPWRGSAAHSAEAEASWFNFGPVPSRATISDWEFRPGFWPVESLDGENQMTGKRVHFSLALPSAAWPVRNATRMAGDYAVTQPGDDQHCRIHPESRRIALIARGKEPIVAKPTLSNKAVKATATGVPHFSRSAKMKML